jgi:hypothetical protein
MINLRNMAFVLSLGLWVECGNVAAIASVGSHKTSSAPLQKLLKVELGHQAKVALTVEERSLKARTKMEIACNKPFQKRPSVALSRTLRTSKKLCFAAIAD